MSARIMHNVDTGVGVTGTAARTTGNVTKTGGGVVGNLAKTGGQTGAAVKRGDVKGAATGLAKG